MNSVPFGKFSPNPPEAMLGIISRIISLSLFAVLLVACNAGRGGLPGAYGIHDALDEPTHGQCDVTSITISYDDEDGLGKIVAVASLVFESGATDSVGITLDSGERQAFAFDFVVSDDDPLLGFEFQMTDDTELGAGASMRVMLQGPVDLESGNSCGFIGFRPTGSERTSSDGEVEALSWHSDWLDQSAVHPEELHIHLDHVLPLRPGELLMIFFERG